MMQLCSIYRIKTVMAMLLTSLALSCCLAWGADDSVAQVSKISGTAGIKRGSESLSAAEGTRLKKDDVLTTGADGSIGIVFNDETTLSLGPDSKLAIQEYLFDPEHSVFSFGVKLFKGTASYVSGLIAKLSPESTRFVTPSASIGVRGTKFVIQVDPL